MPPLHFPLWRDRFGVDTYCMDCLIAHVADGVVEPDTFAPTWDADFCDACLAGFSS